MAKCELHQAIKDGDLRRITELLNATGPRVDVNEHDRAGWTPLRHAVTSPKADVNLLRTLVRHGARLDEDNIITSALNAGNPEKIAALLEAGASIDYRDEHGYDALVNAVHGRDVLRDPRLIELLNLLIASGVSLSGMTVYGESGVRVLSRLGRFDAVQLLLRAGANPGDLKFTPLIEAVAFGSVVDVEAVIERGVNLEDRDYWERTAWLIAIQTGEISKAVLLRQRGADVNARGRCGRPSLFYAIENHQLPMLRWLVEIGTDIRQSDDFDDTALIQAVDSGNEEIVSVLLEAGADVSQGCKLGTPLSHACNREVAMLLLEAGADPLELSTEGRRAILGYPSEPDIGLLTVSASEFRQWRSRRFGAHNPSTMNIPFWEAMIRSGITAYEAGQLFAVEDKAWFKIGRRRTSAQETPIWCAQRFGQSITFMPDGRIIQVAGEHEDYYDRDFCIYNDVFVHEHAGRIKIYGYPEAAFPPTDFHTATRMGSHIYLLGSLGYSGKRRYGETPVYRLDSESFQIDRLETTGDQPGWIFNHRATQISDCEIEVRGGKVVTQTDGEEHHSKNTTAFVLDIERRVWRVKS